MPDTVEIVAVLFSLAAVWLTVREKIICWPVGLIAVVAYGIFFYRLRLYADMTLQAVFFAQGVYGWWYWARGGVEHTEPEITRLGARAFLPLLLGLAVAAWVVGNALARTDAAAPHLDAFLALTSLTANLLLARKILESWWLWVFADVLYIGLFLHKGAPLSAGLYAVFLVMATSGAVRWQRRYRGRAAPPVLEPA
jgi:nicotinamide mononucleotide transporter